MRKRKLMIILAICCLTVAIGAYAAPAVIEKIEYATAEIQPGSLTVKNNRALREIAKEKADGEDVQADVEAYAHFLADLYPTEEEIRYIDTLIGEGYDTKALIEIFEFWQDTQEDISIIKEVYAFRPPIEDVLYWVDEAFIQLSAEGKTKGQYEGLSVEEVQAYYDNGISFEDIRMADKLSRHGTKKIKNIIADKKADVSWYEIIDGVYEMSTPERRKADVEKYKEIKNPHEILASRKLAKEKIMPLSEALDGVLEEKSSVLHLAEKKAEKKRDVKEKFAAQGLWVETEEKIAE